MAEAGAVAASTVALGQTVGAYQFFLPRLSDVRKADPADPSMRGDVVLGQIAAGSLALSIGMVFTILTGSRVPIFVAGIAAFVIAGVYHFAMTH